MPAAREAHLHVGGVATRRAVASVRWRAYPGCGVVLRSRLVTAVAACLVVLVSSGAGVAARTPRPDLAVARVTVPVAASGPFAVRDVVKTNVRRAARVAYFVSRDRVRSRGDGQLAGGRTVTPGTKRGTARLRVPGSVPAGPYFVLACVDAGGRIAERNERNNCRASTGRITLLAPFRPRPLDVVETPDMVRAASARIGPAGGVVQATGADGTVFTLTVPRNGLVAAVTVTMTPLASVSGLPGGTAGVHAVDLEPEGLTFLRTAALEIAPPNLPARARRTALTSVDGRDVALHPVTSDPARVVLPLAHFTTAYEVDWSAAQRAAQQRRVPSDRARWAQQNAARASRAAQLAELVTYPNGEQERAVNARVVAYYVWGNEVVRPALQAALRNPLLVEDAFDVLNAWERQLEVDALGDGRLAALRGELGELAERAIAAAKRRLIDECYAASGPAAIPVILKFVRWLTLRGEADGAAEAADVLRRCARFELTVTASTTLTAASALLGTANVRVTNLVIDLAEQAPYTKQLELGSWDIQPIGELAANCSIASKSLAFEVPDFQVTAVDLDTGRRDPRGPLPERIVLDVSPGLDRLQFSLVCPDAALPLAMSSIYATAFAYGHAAESNGPARGFRITAWQRVVGAAWAVERVFDNSGEAPGAGGSLTFTEQTRFFLRHAPLPPDPAG